jgi:predicted Co/Zn/Cd cation transporter (cation efflux family)
MSSAAFTRFVKASGALLIAIFSGLFILGFVIGETDLMSELFEKIGTIAEIGAIAAFSLWIIRILLMQLKKRKFTYVRWIQLAFKFLKEHHILIGWAAFSAAFVHGTYFLLQTSEEKESIFSGFVTLLEFTILITFGLFLDKRGKGSKYLKYKQIHQGIAVLFGIALGVHLLFG